MLPIRSIAVSTAVLCFFVIGIVGSLGGLSPYVCCKRAILGAIVAYLTAGAASKVVNAILTQAVIARELEKREQTGDSEK
ncbi:MAG: hypothetical protein ACM3VT_19990 [Solirubrobacterales bacterium]